MNLIYHEKPYSRVRAEEFMSQKTINEFTKSTNIEHPIICGPMYPCSNPELVAAVSEAGGIGVIQPISLVYVYNKPLREGIQHIKSLTQKPVGLNIIVEKTAKRYEDRMKEWVDIALEEGIRFFVTSLGNPRWVVEKVHKYGGLVYHDVTEKKWAAKAVAENVDGLICVNNRAGGHAGTLSAEQLFKDISSFGLPVICAGGVGNKEDYEKMLQIGYQGVQMGTRFIASSEASAHDDYKQAIIKAKEEDIVLSEKISGVPVSVINTDYIKKTGTKSGPIAKMLLKGSRTKHFMRAFYFMKSIFQLKKSNIHGSSYKDFFQAGKSVHGIHEVKSVKEIIDSMI